MAFAVIERILDPGFQIHHHLEAAVARHRGPQRRHGMNDRRLVGPRRRRIAGSAAAEQPSQEGHEGERGSDQGCLHSRVICLIRYCNQPG